MASDDEVYEQSSMPVWALLLLLFPPALPFFFRLVAHSLSLAAPNMRARTASSLAAHSTRSICGRYRVKLSRDELEFGYCCRSRC